MTATIPAALPAPAPEAARPQVVDARDSGDDRFAHELRRVEPRDGRPSGPRPERVATSRGARRDNAGASECCERPADDGDADAAPQFAAGDVAQALRALALPVVPGLPPNPALVVAVAAGEVGEETAEAATPTTAAVADTEIADGVIIVSPLGARAAPASSEPTVDVTNPVVPVRPGDEEPRRAAPVAPDTADRAGKIAVAPPRLLTAVDDTAPRALVPALDATRPALGATAQAEPTIDRAIAQGPAPRTAPAFASTPAGPDAVPTTAPDVATPLPSAPSPDSIAATADSADPAPVAVELPPIRAARSEAVTVPVTAVTRPQPAPAEQLVAVLAPLRHRADGTYELRLELKPPELGRVEIRVEMRDGVMHAHLRAEQPGAAQALRDALTQLRDHLTGHGVQTGALNVDAGGAGARRGHDRPEVDGAEPARESASSTRTTSNRTEPIRPEPNRSERAHRASRLDVHA